MLIIPGWTSDDKVPKTVAKNEWGAGPLNIGAIALKVVLFGNAPSGATIPFDTRQPVTTAEEVDSYLSSGRCELARMAHAALEIPGAAVEIVPVEETGSQAVRRCVFSGTSTTAGELFVQLDEVPVRVQIPAGTSASAAGDLLEDAVNAAQDGRLFCTAVNTSGSVLNTVFTPGIRGNQHTLYVDTSRMPAGLTFSVPDSSSIVQSGAGPLPTIAGVPTSGGDYVLTITTGGANGTAVFSLTRNGSSVATGVTVPLQAAPYSVPGDGIIITFTTGTYVLNETYAWTSTVPLPNGGKPFHLGTGTDDIDAALDGTSNQQNDYIAAAHNDATNVGLIETASNAKAAFDVGLLENYVIAMNGALAPAVSIGQTTMNDQLGGLYWTQYGTEHPSRVAARLAAFFSTIEGAQPNFNYDDYVVPGAAPQYKPSDVAGHSTLKSALNNSVSPLTTKDGRLTIVRAICSRSLNGSTPDYRTYDRGDVMVPIRCRKELVALGDRMRAANPYAGPDLPDGQLPPVGTLTPNLWKSAVQSFLLEHEKAQFNWLEQVASHPAEAEWDNTSKRIMSVVPTIAKTQNHQIGVIVRQQSA
jgi:phage tail sheath gpL-like